MAKKKSPQTRFFDEDGHMTFQIGPVPGCELINLEQYVSCLNNLDSPYSNINPSSMVANPLVEAGCCIKTGPNTFGIMFGHEFSPLVFRGENKAFKNFLPSALRLDLSKEKNRIEHCIKTIKKREFLDFFKRTPYFTRCQKFEVLGCKFRFDMEAIAQHYGFISNCIDVTRDHLVAMFFAYTHVVNGHYELVPNFYEYCPTLYVSDLPTLFASYPNQIGIIGFQALLRPYAQRAMSIEVPDKNLDIKQLFQKIELPKSRDFANEIFEYFERGRKLLPKDFINSAACEIRGNKVLDRKLFFEYCDDNGLNPIEFSQKLDRRYTVTGRPWDVSNWDKFMINWELDNGIIELLKRHVGYRKVCRNIENKIPA